jgi:hypothetical protein
LETSTLLKNSNFLNSSKCWKHLAQTRTPILKYNKLCRLSSPIICRPDTREYPNTT